MSCKPDFVFMKRRVVVFLDSCFWHVCPYHHNIPKSNKKYWLKKLKRNRERDHEVNRILRKSQWKVLRIWEHQIRKNLDKAVERIELILKG